MNWIPFASTAIAALVALTGYLISQQTTRRERKAKFYAEALLAIKEFEELPYRIAKRRDSTSDTRASIGNAINDAYVAMSYYQAWLRIDSPRVAVAYDNLARRAGRFGTLQQQHAWSQDLIDADAHMDLGSRYYYGTKQELSVCVLAMRRELRPSAVFLSKSTRNHIRRQQEERAASGETVGEMLTGIDYAATHDSLPETQSPGSTHS